MCKYFDASDKYRVETTQNMDPFHKLPPGAGMKAGLIKAHITVYEPGDDAHPSLPTLREFLAKHIDPATGLLSYDFAGPKLTIDPAPLRALPPEYLDYRVSPGASFVTHDALERAKTEGHR